MDKIAILYQAKLPPVKDGIQKPMKPRGYSDSGADIAYSLQQQGFTITTQNDEPDVFIDTDWVFPDTKEGIQLALDKGATIFWLNTVLYKGHPIESFFKNAIQLVGQLPQMVDRYDDKLITNKLLKENGLPIPNSQLIKKKDVGIYKLNISFPLIVKPIRGRGSQGVFLVTNESELKCKLSELFSENSYGNSVYVEEFLSGQEITITVMPPGNYTIEDKVIKKQAHWSLPAVKRFNHQNGVAPYNGTVAVINNSEVLSNDELDDGKIKTVCKQCEKAARLVNAKAPIRIDCRADANGKYFIFDLNMKPNMTGTSRSHRKDQDSLSALAARKIGWTYNEFLLNILRQKWQK